MPASSTVVLSPNHVQSNAERPRWAAWIHRHRVSIALLCLLIGIVGGFPVGRRIGFQQAAMRRRELPNGSFLCKPGPWGDLSYTPFTISAPESILPLASLEAAGTHWFFKGYTLESFTTLLQSTSLSPEQQQALTTPAVLHAGPDGVELDPTPDMVISLPDDARERFYEILAAIPENASQFDYFPANSLADRFSPETGVSADTVALFKHLSVLRDNYVVFSGLSVLLSRVEGDAEKLHLLKALTTQRTLTLRLHITPETDATALTEYWGRGVWNTDVQTILQSLTTIPNGTWISILMVLPPAPTAQLYDYPSPANNAPAGAPANADGNWTSLNFFRDVSNPDFANPQSAMEEVRQNYFPSTGDPRYGDLIVFTNPSGAIIHSAIYIADDICYTKNGNNVFSPWMLTNIADVVARFSLQTPPDQPLTVGFYRSKSY